MTPAKKNKAENKSAAKLQKIRIKLKSYDQKVLNHATTDIIDCVKRTGAIIVGPVPLPTKRVRYTVHRSIHINSKSREQFEHKTHTRLLDIYNCTDETVDQLMRVDLPSSIYINIKL